MNYLVSEASLSASADAIRTKTNSNETIEWNGENGFADAIDAISVGTDTSSDTVTPETLIEGTTAHNSNGESITGTNPYKLESTNTTVNTQANLIEQIKTALEGKAGGGGSDSGSIETCEVIINYPNNISFDVEYTKFSAGTLILETEITSSESGEVTFEVVKNTMISVSHALGGGMNFMFTPFGEVYDYITGGAYAVFEVYGEGTITILDSGV